MKYLDELEAQSIYLLREAQASLDGLALLWSGGKDSTVMVWLAHKAFLGTPPFPVVSLESPRAFPELRDFRDRTAEAWRLDFRVESCPSAGAAGLADGLKAIVGSLNLAGVLLGCRRDETALRAKERVFSPRDAAGQWANRSQPPEFWDHYRAAAPPGGHLRVHPLLAWRELDIWRYIRREAIPVAPLYCARDGRRYRSLGDRDDSRAIESRAADLDQIIEELATTGSPERAGRGGDDPAGGAGEDDGERLRIAGAP